MSKGVMYVDNIRVEYDNEPNVLAVIRKAGIEMPTFCYYSELSVYGACRMCVVEDEARQDRRLLLHGAPGRLHIRTNTARLLKHRRMILELMLSSHCRDCTTCEKKRQLPPAGAGAALRRAARPLRGHPARTYEMDDSSPALVRDPNKCILCGDCVRVCDEMQGMGILNFAHRGSEPAGLPGL